MRLLLTGIAADEKEAPIQPVPVKKQINLSELSMRAHRKSKNLSHAATAGESATCDLDLVDDYTPLRDRMEADSVLNRRLSEYSAPVTSMSNEE